MPTDNRNDKSSVSPIKKGEWVKLTENTYKSGNTGDFLRIIKTSCDKAGKYQRLYHYGLIPMGSRGWIPAKAVTRADPDEVFIYLMTLAGSKKLRYITSNYNYFSEMWEKYHEQQ